MNNLERVDPAEEHRTYRSKPYWRRMSVAVAGSAMHFLLAVLLLWVLYSAVGFHGFDRPEVTEAPRWQVSRVVPDSPAAEMGLRPGDRIIDVAGTEIETFGDLRGALGSLAENPATVTVVRDSGTVRLEGVIGVSPRDGISGFLGVGPELAAPGAGEPAGGPGAVAAGLRPGGPCLGGGDRRPCSACRGWTVFLGPLVDFDSGEVPAGEAGGGDPNRVVSIVGVARIGGALAQEDVAALLSFLAYLNVFFGVLNLFPLLPLDGGHVVIATYERLRSFGGRRYQADAAKMLPAAYLFVFVLVAVGLVALSRDIIDPLNPVGLGRILQPPASRHERDHRNRTTADKRG